MPVVPASNLGFTYMQYLHQASVLQVCGTYAIISEPSPQPSILPLDEPLPHSPIS